MRGVSYPDPPEQPYPTQRCHDAWDRRCPAHGDADSGAASRLFPLASRQQRSAGTHQPPASAGPPQQRESGGHPSPRRQSVTATGGTKGGRGEAAEPPKLEAARCGDVPLSLEEKRTPRRASTFPPAGAAPAASGRPLPGDSTPEEPQRRFPRGKEPPPPLAASQPPSPPGQLRRGDIAPPGSAPARSSRRRNGMRRAPAAGSDPRSTAAKRPRGRSQCALLKGGRAAPPAAARREQAPPPAAPVSPPPS